MTNQKSQRGIAATQIVIVLGALIAIVGLEMLALGFSEVYLSGGGADSAKAYRIAEAGARDALMRIARDKKYSCATTDCYQIDIETNGCADLIACAKIQVGTGVGTVPDPKIITSKGMVKNKTRTVRVNVILDSNLSGEIQSTTWTEFTD
ncbi:MAG: hypothetical protein WCJ29_03760 [bacterium]